MKDMSKHTDFRVIIAGGGLAGLTLANALQHAGIDYLLLESRSIIAPQVGASIGLAPNGSRILDQLSCYEEIERLTEPIESMGNHTANGDDLLPRTDGFELVHARCVMSYILLNILPADLSAQTIEFVFLTVNSPFKFLRIIYSIKAKFSSTNI